MHSQACRPHSSAAPPQLPPQHPLRALNSSAFRLSSTRADGDLAGGFAPRFLAATGVPATAAAAADSAAATTAAALVAAGAVPTAAAAAAAAVTAAVTFPGCGVAAARRRGRLLPPGGVAASAGVGMTGLRRGASVAADDQEAPRTTGWGQHRSCRLGRGYAAAATKGAATSVGAGWRKGGSLNQRAWRARVRASKQPWSIGEVGGVHEGAAGLGASATLETEWGAPGCARCLPNGATDIPRSLQVRDVARHALRRAVEQVFFPGPLLCCAQAAVARAGNRRRPLSWVGAPPWARTRSAGVSRGPGRAAGVALRRHAAVWPASGRQTAGANACCAVAPLHRVGERMQRRRALRGCGANAALAPA